MSRWGYKLYMRLVKKILEKVEKPAIALGRPFHANHGARAKALRACIMSSVSHSTVQCLRIFARFFFFLSLLGLFLHSTLALHTNSCPLGFSLRVTNYRGFLVRHCCPPSQQPFSASCLLAQHILLGGQLPFSQSQGMSLHWVVAVIGGGGDGHGYGCFNPKLPMALSFFFSTSCSGAFLAPFAWKPKRQALA